MRNQHVHSKHEVVDRGEHECEFSRSLFVFRLLGWRINFGLRRSKWLTRYFSDLNRGESGEVNPDLAAPASRRAWSCRNPACIDCHIQSFRRGRTTFAGGPPPPSVTDIFYFCAWKRGTRWRWGSKRAELDLARLVWHPDLSIGGRWQWSENITRKVGCCEMDTVPISAIMYILHSF
jgi:hypothetical protein